MCEYKCIHCAYVSKRKYNLQRHIRTTHKIENAQLKIADTQPKIADTQLKIANSELKIANFELKIANNQLKIADEFAILSCAGCNKSFSTTSSLKRHKPVCKGVSNILECHYCHKLCVSISSKSKHIQKCDKAKIAKNIKINNGTINNTTNIINNTNSHNVTTTNNITNNFTINFPRGIDVPIKFNTDHITDDKFRKLVVENKNNMESIFENFSRLLYEDKSNICVKKTNLKSEYAQVHLNERWINKIDNLVFPKLTKNLVEEISKMMDSKEEFLLKKLKTHIFDAISKFFDEMGIDPYDLEGEEKQVIQQLKTLIKIAMGIVFDITD